MNSPIFVNAKFLSQPLTGVQRFASELSLLLKQNLPNCHFVSPKNLLQKDLSKKLNPLLIGRQSGHLWEQVELPYFLHKHNSPLLLNLCNIAPIFYSNQIVALHDMAFIRNPHWFSKKFQLAYRMMIPKIAKKSKHLITVSQFSKDEIIELLKIHPTHITVISNAASNLNVVPSGSLRPIKEDYIFTASSINPRKNLITLLQAFHKLVKIKDIKLVLLGNVSSAFGATKELLPFLDHPNIIHKTYASDSELKALYEHAKLFVYPSLYEGFGLPPLEALSSGCPVLVSDIPPHREVCVDAATYFNPLDSGELAEKILKQLRLPKNPERGYKRARDFSWQKSCDTLISCLNTLTAPKRESSLPKII